MPWLLLALLWMNVQPVSTGVPNRQPQLAAAQGLVAMTFAAGQSIYFASSTDNGRTFTAPTRVADAKNLAVGRHRGPRVAILSDAIVVTAITEGDLVAWRSTDRGKTWTRSGMVNDVPKATREGLHAMAADPQGVLFSAWLDLRATGTKLYGSRSVDGGLTWSKNLELYSSPEGTICQCCDPALAFDERGRLAIMWRNVMNGSRDLYVSVDSSPPQKLGAGTWKLNACPMDGGGLVVDHNRVVSAWRRDGQVFLAEPGKAEIQAGTGKDVAIAAAKKGVYVGWTNGTAIEVLTPGASRPLQLAAEGAYVNLLGLQDGAVLAAWENNGAIETRRIE